MNIDDEWQSLQRTRTIIRTECANNATKHSKSWGSFFNFLLETFSLPHQDISSCFSSIFKCLALVALLGITLGLRFS